MLACLPTRRRPLMLRRWQAFAVLNVVCCAGSRMLSWTPRFWTLTPCRMCEQERIFPLKRCKFVTMEFSCPRDPEYVLEEEFGLDWRIPKKGFKTFNIDPAMKRVPDTP